MMNNADMPAWPVPGVRNRDYVLVPKDEMIGGLTKRELFAMAAMQGLLANPGGPVQANTMSGTGYCNCDGDDIAAWAVDLADKTLAQLSKEPQA